MKYSPAYSPSVPGHLRVQEFVRSLDIPARLVIDAGESVTGFHFQPEGEFPRRVVQGDIIASIDGLSLLSPMSGIVSREESVYTIKVGGALKIGRPEAPTAVDSLEQLCELLDTGGIVSLDGFGLSVSSILKAKPEILVLSTLEADGSINWNRTGLLERLPDLKNLLNSFGFRAEITGEGLRSDPFKAAERQIPNLCQKYIPSLNPGKPVTEQGIGYLGPATLHALLDLLYNNTGFLRRPVVFHSLEKSYLAVVPNGSAPGTIVDHSGNSAWRAGAFYQTGEKVSFSQEEQKGISIYRASAFYQVSDEDEGVLPCTFCMACQKVCPVDASVLSLFTGETESFVRADCFECGLCEYVCESNIPLLNEIRRTA